VAQATLDCTVKSVQLFRGHANTYLVPSGNLAIKDFVGTENKFEVIYRCMVSGTPTQWAIVERKVNTTSSVGYSIDWNAIAYPVLTTPQLQQYGLGFSGFYFVRNEWSNNDYGKFSNNDGEDIFWKNLPTADSDGYVELYVWGNYRFSKINDNLDTIINTPVTVQSLPFPLLAVAIRDNESSALSPTAQVMASMPTLTVAQRACTPFTNTVKLPLIYADALNNINIGDSLPPTDFWIEMRCPSNIGHIGFYVQSPQGFENEAQGVIKINPSSSAKGIGLQITTRGIPYPVYIDNSVAIGTTYQPIKFGSNNRYRVYSSLRWGAGINTDPLTHETDHTAPLDTIPLRVAVYRTGTVVPGTYNASIFIHLVYR